MYVYESLRRCHGLPVRFEERCQQRVTAAEARKDEEREVAMRNLRAEVKVLVDKAEADREEFQRLYSQVCEYTYGWWVVRCSLVVEEFL